MSDIVNKLWGFCHTLRHDGIDYGDYIEQITYLLFLKMADERGVAVPKQYTWAALRTQPESELIQHFTNALRDLSEQPSLLGEIFEGAVSRFNEPANLKKLITVIDEEEWTGLDIDVQGAAFEGLLERAASEGKKGAGQYFTPRPVIRTIVNVMRPDPTESSDFTICDPACGTGGFLMTAYEWFLASPNGNLTGRKLDRIKQNTFYGQELVQRPRRLALMNLFLHGLRPTIHLGDTLYSKPRDQKFDCILTNPPFGTKGATQIPVRDDFLVETSNKQLNFLQHVLSTLKPGGRAAMVLPDNCLFENKAGELFERMMKDNNVHTIMRLPRGTFTPYSQGVKANVIFFEKGKPTKEVWIYDNRSNIPTVTKNDRPLNDIHFRDFEMSYGSDPNGGASRTDGGPLGRFRRFDIDEIRQRGYKLDITWLRDEELDGHPEAISPQELASQAIIDLEAVVDELREVLLLLETWPNP